MNKDINVQFTPEQLSFFAGVGTQRYQHPLRTERPKMSSITNKETLEHESNKDVEKGTRNATDEEALEKESVRMKSEKIRNVTDEKAVRKESVKSKRQRIGNATDEKTLRKDSVRV